jgi:signal transduction histidine kinase
MRSRRPQRAWFIPSRQSAPLAAAAVVSAALFCVPALGLVNAFSNSLAGNLLLCVPFLIAYVLGCESGTAAGLAGVAVLAAALQVASGGVFSPIELMITVGPWAAGQIVRSRRRLAEQLRVRNDELLAQQQAYAAEAVRYERSRIAADLHDMVGHALSLMVVQAGAGQRAALARGGGAGAAGAGEATTRAALESVAEAAREAQAEVGLLAGLLSGEQAPGAQAPPDQAPRDQASRDKSSFPRADRPGPAAAAPSAASDLDLVGELVRRVQGAGLAVTYRLICADDPGKVGAVSAGVASRVVTEALTNALKHAPGAPVTVDVVVEGGGLTVTVENGAARHSGNELARAGGGHGLTGMRDRVLARGGRFDAGPTADGNWRVRALLPASHQ